MGSELVHLPKVLLYHDVTQHGRIDADTASARLARQFDWMVDRGFRFASMHELVAGGLGPKDVVVTFDDALRSFADVAWPVLRERGVPVTLYAVSEFSERDDARDDFLSWEELRAFAAEGVDVDCHAATHVPLDEIPEDRMREEVSASTRRFREMGFTPVTFAYPFGRYDEAVKDALRDEGFRLAVTVMKGGGDSFEVRRRLLTGAEGPPRLRLLLSERFFDIRDAARRFVPRRYLRQDLPIPRPKWGGHGFGLPEAEAGA